MLNIFKKDFSFFDLFDAMGAHVVSSTQRLHRLASAFSENRAETQRIHEEEHKADELTHQALNRLVRSYLPPIDREDVHALVGSLDDVVDFVDEMAKRLDLYHINSIDPAFIKQTDVLMQAAAKVNDAVRHLRVVKTLAELSPTLAEIHKLESVGDDNHHASLERLFDGTSEPLDVLKWKELHTLVETAIDACEDVGNVLERIVLKK